MNNTRITAKTASYRGHDDGKQYQDEIFFNGLTTASFYGVCLEENKGKTLTREEYEAEGRHRASHLSDYPATQEKYIQKWNDAYLHASYLQEAKHKAERDARIRQLADMAQEAYKNGEHFDVIFTDNGRTLKGDYHGVDKSGLGIRVLVANDETGMYGVYWKNVKTINPKLFPDNREEKQHDSGTPFCDCDTCVENKKRHEDEMYLMAEQAQKAYNRGEIYTVTFTQRHEEIMVGLFGGMHRDGYVRVYVPGSWFGMYAVLYSEIREIKAPEPGPVAESAPDVQAEEPAADEEVEAYTAEARRKDAKPEPHIRQATEATGPLWRHLRAIYELEGTAQDGRALGIADTAAYKDPHISVDVPLLTFKKRLETWTAENPSQYRRAWLLAFCETLGLEVPGIAYGG